MRLFPVLFLLLATSAQAQPTVGGEVVWRTTHGASTYRMAPQAARIAADRNGFVVAWSEVEDGLSRAYAGRLDAGGHLISVGVRTAATADAPSVVPFGDRYVAAWLEPGNDGRPLLVTGALDRDFRLLGARPIALTAGPPIVTTSSRAYVGSGTFLYEVDKDGVPLIVYDTPRPVDDVATSGDQVGYVLHSFTHTPSFCGFFRCSLPFDTYDLTFTWLYRLTSGMSSRVVSDAPPAVGTNGDSFLVVWFEPIAVKGALLGSNFDHPFFIGTRPSSFVSPLLQPQVAWDGARWVAVWPSGAGIEGAAITPDASVTTFRVAARGSRPSITAARPGRFLVTYESVDFPVRRLASRLIDFGPPGRERAVR